MDLREDKADVEFQGHRALPAGATGSMGPQDAASQAGSSLPRPSYPGRAAYSSVNRLSAVPTGGASLPQATPLTPRGLGDLQAETKAATPSAASGGTRTELLRDARSVGLASH